VAKVLVNSENWTTKMSPNHILVIVSLLVIVHELIYTNLTLLFPKMKGLVI